MNEFNANKIAILQAIIGDDLRRGSMLNSGNNDDLATVHPKGVSSVVRLAERL
jgi:hypothetical protein